MMFSSTAPGDILFPIMNLIELKKKRNVSRLNETSVDSVWPKITNYTNKFYTAKKQQLAKT